MDPWAEDGSATPRAGGQAVVVAVDENEVRPRAAPTHQLSRAVRQDPRRTAFLQFGTKPLGKR